MAGRPKKDKATQKKQPVIDAVVNETEAVIPPIEESKVTVKTKYTLRFYMMVISAASSVIGLIMFVMYFFSMNMVIGAPGIVMAVTGVFVFNYYWKKEGNVSVDHIKLGGEESKVETGDCNCLNIYRDKILFQNMDKPSGFPMQCVNLKKSFFVNIWDEKTKRLIPFVLPDQQYMDPIVFAQRVLGLPAHKRIFERKPKLLQKLKTAMLVIAIGIVWLLILTTTSP